MELLFVFNLISCCIVLWFFIYALKYHREFYCRPSTLVLLFMHARIQWPSLFMWNKITSEVEDLYSFYILINGFMLICTIVIFLSGMCGDIFNSKKIYSEIIRPSEWHYKILKPTVPALLFISFAITFIYLMLVPFSETGLYKLFSNPLGLSFARESSLKLLQYDWMKYVFPWQINTIAPFLLVFSAVAIASKQNARVRTIAIGLLVWASFNMILVGHRSGFAFVPLVLILTFVILKKDRFRWRYVLLGLAIMVSLPALVTLMREGRDISFATSLQYLNTIAIGRIFKTPLIVGMFYTDYADHHGFIGASVIRPLAEFFGDDYVLLAREIGQTYVAPTSETILSNANFLFVYYVGFGLWAIPISIIFMMFFDLLLIPASKYAMASLPIVVLLFIKGGGLSEGVFTTSFISGGYVFIPVIAFVVNFFYKNSIRKRDRQVYIEDSS